LRFYFYVVITPSPCICTIIFILWRLVGSNDLLNVD
jgi:hypothetical protein